MSDKSGEMHIKGKTEMKIDWKINNLIFVKTKMKKSKMMMNIYLKRSYRINKVTN
jgi:hypothetical protein